MRYRSANGFEFHLRILDRLAGTCFPKLPAHPLAHRNAIAAGKPPDLVHLGIGEQNSESLTHTVSIL